MSVIILGDLGVLARNRVESCGNRGLLILPVLGLKKGV